MIDEFSAKNYGCLRDVTLRLTPFHALIGPNDSGKSTILRGIRTLGQLAGEGFRHEAWGIQPFDPGIPPTQQQQKEAGFRAVELRAARGQHQLELSVPLQGSFTLRSDEGTRYDGNSILYGMHAKENWSVVRELAGVRLVRFDPDALRAPSNLIPEGSVIGFLDERGQGLAGVYQAIQGRGDEAFQTISDSVRRHFPSVKAVRVPAISHTHLALELQLSDGTKVRTNQLSEGLLYYLAFAAIPYLATSSILLVEEPENGLHPSRIADVIRILRAFSQEHGTQVILATHSPLVVNEMSPDEVTLVTRPSVEQGTIVTPIRETKNFEERSKVYALGELWLSYADGKVEGELVDPA